MSQMGPRSEEICSGQAISDGRKGGKTRRTDRLITIGRLQSGMLIKCFQHLENICLIVVGFTDCTRQRIDGYINYKQNTRLVNNSKIFTFLKVYIPMSLDIIAVYDF